MSEIRKIEADLEKLEDFQEMSLRLGFPIPMEHGPLRRTLMNKLEKAKKQPEDPWRRAKGIYVKWTGTHHGSDHPLKHVADYIRFLEKENRRLVAELDNRPVVWTIRSKSTGILVKTGDHPDIYCLEHANQFNPAIYTIEPYNRGANK